MTNPFAAGADFVSPSVNRVVFLDLPGLNIPASLVGAYSYSLLGASALQGLVREKTTQLQIDPLQPNLLRRFDDCFVADDPLVRQTAAAIAREYGRCLGLMLVILKRGDPASRETRPDWHAVHWDLWRDIRTIWVGGGVVAGHLGEIAVDVAQKTVSESGFPACIVGRSPYGSDLSMLGAACQAPPATRTALAFDFGHTQVKRSLVHYDASGPRLIPWPAMPAPCELYEYQPWPLEKAPAVFAGMVEILADAWQTAVSGGHVLDPVLLLSIAVYLYNGHPYDGHAQRGCYARLQVLCDNLQQFLATTMSERIGQKMTVKLIHDGAAAAAVYRGSRQTAVLTLGTALGVGFPDGGESDYV